MRIIAFLSFLLPFLIALIQSYFNELSSIAHPNFMGSAKVNQWSLVGNLNSISTYMKANENSTLVTYRAVTVLNAELDDIVQVFQTRETLWVPSVHKMQLVNSTRSSQQDATDVYHVISTLPFPFQSRDFVIQRTMYRSLDNKYVAFNHTSIDEPGLYPASDEYVRGHLNYSNWVFQDFEEYCRDYSEDVEDQPLPANTSSSLVVEVTPPIDVKVVVQGKCTSKLACKFNSLLRLSADWLFSASSEASSPAHSVIESADRMVRFKASSEFSQLCSSRSSPSTASDASIGQVNRTLLVVETLVDAGGSLPHWLVSYMHRYVTSLG